jgi:acetate kinase
VTGDLVDRRDIVREAEKGNERAALAIELESYRLKKYIGAYVAALGRVDALVFTAGVGEMLPMMRWKAASGLESMGIVIDERRNALSQTRNAETRVSADGSRVEILVIPTDEELVMTEDTQALISGTYDVHTSFTYGFQSRSYRNNDRDGRFADELAVRPELEEVVVPRG